MDQLLVEKNEGCALLPGGGGTTDDQKEGMAAFLEKRTPDFKNK